MGQDLYDFERWVLLVLGLLGRKLCYFLQIFHCILSFEHIAYNYNLNTYSRAYKFKQPIQTFTKKYNTIYLKTIRKIWFYNY